MRPLLRALGALTVSVVAVGALTSCGLGRGERYEDESTLTGADKITSVRLENDSGSVKVNGVEDGASTPYKLHRELDYRGERPSGATHRIEDGVLVLGDCGNRCSVSYTVDVPAGVPVGGEIANGAIRLARVGAVEVSTGNGRVELRGVTGPVKVRSTNGPVKGTALQTDRIQARTSNGKIDLASDTPADIRAETSNGAVTLTVPEAAYRVSADTSNGSRAIDVPDDPKGKFTLDIRTSNGAVTVRNG
ncbi:DUF4097 family beta strand repeat-containing protein [Streptomyces albidoflavus]|jgi:hypothetical protein|uniref:DUF4097 family beta strand repeat-containing protein n=1 Tax=Streptomyces TaxID=1883 RepID=UPI000368033C|nr:MULTISPECIES: DUF4097 family beta strand repeat-containing protein [Streptomyces]MBO1285106.1 DUF4097 family beta strand repeat protein [Streptomyces sampsonii]MYW61090.1 DUF4097 family beta strand repeat protein [Streptomyces sp. SID8370]MYW84804.1 DUF4097 family beta strand repeat protein [Streptomyces sp. SID8371]NUW09549.1 DUF4097 family beta strand repeat protein [Streptomyces sp. CAI-21]NVI31487.1 DUF4097 family beta strand repeat protein [Streptomyces sp. CAI-17]